MSDISELLPIDNIPQRTSTARLDFAPTQQFLDLMGPFLNKSRRDSILANLAISSVAQAELAILPTGGQLTHKQSQELAIAEYGRKLAIIASQQFVFGNQISARRDERGNIRFLFDIVMTDQQTEVITSFNEFKLDKSRRLLGAQATIPLRNLTPDKDSFLKARDEIVARFIKGSPTEKARSGLYARDIHWSERVNFVRVPDPVDPEPTPEIDTA